MPAYDYDVRLINKKYVGGPNNAQRHSYELPTNTYFCSRGYMQCCTINRLSMAIIYTRGEGGLRPPSPLVWVAGATLISSEEVVSSKLLLCSVDLSNY